MKITPGTRRKAVLSVYKVRRKRKGGHLLAKELERAWHPLGLRRSDLDLALKDMTQQHLLEPKASPRGTAYELTWLGECAAREVFGDHPLASIRDWLTLLRAGQRRLKKPGGIWSDHRRTGDLPSTAH
jgi:hypothetical protein